VRFFEEAKPAIAVQSTREERIETIRQQLRECGDVFANLESALKSEHGLTPSLDRRRRAIQKVWNESLAELAELRGETTVIQPVTGNNFRPAD